MSAGKRIGAVLLAAGLLAPGAGCTRMVGAYRGPEPFGGKDYVIAAPRVQLAGNARVVVLLLADERPANERELDWVRQSNPMGETVGQPREVRREFDRAIKSGLLAHPNIRIVPAEEFAVSRQADLVISGRIVRAQAEKKIGWTTADFHGLATIEMSLRDGRGKALTAAPVAFSANVKQAFDPPRLDTQVDEIPPGYAARAMEDAIRAVVESFVSSRELADALRQTTEARR